MAKKPVSLTTFTYTGVNARGRKIKDEITEATTSQARIYLKKQGIEVRTIRKKKEGFSFSNKLAANDITIFARQLATMMKSGIPLIQSFDVIAQGVDKPAMKKLVYRIKADIEGGNSLNEALRKHPEHFDSLFCSLIEAGEKSGSLEIMLERVATHKEKGEILKMKVRKAFKYPLFIVVASLVITAILLVKVIPVFKGLFDSIGSDLPWFTQKVVNMSEWVQSYGIFAAILLVAGFIALRKALKTNKKLSNALERILLHIPIFGDLVYKAVIARFSRTLATTFAVGLPLIDALDAAGKASGNIVYEEAVSDIRSDVIGGQQLNFAMRSSRMFPSMAIQMTAIGEESGDLDKMLDKVAIYYESEVDNAIEGLTSMLEPLIIVILGFIVGGLVLAMYMPIFMMGKAF